MEDNNLNRKEVSDKVNEDNKILNNNGKNNDKTKKILIAIIVVIVLFLLALTIYVVVNKKDNSVDGGKENNIQENESNNVSNDNQEIDSEKNVTIDLDGGFTTQSLSNFIAKKVKLVEPTKTGYIFDGWEILSGETSIDENNIITIGNIAPSIKVKWKSNLSNFTIDLDGGATTQQFKEKYEVGTTIILEEPRKVGYYFYGWQINDSYSTSNELTISGNTKLKAIWLKTGNIKYEIRVVDSNRYLYINGKKIDDIKLSDKLLCIEEVNDVLVVINDNELYLIDKNASLTKYDYKLKFNDKKLYDQIKSYKIKNGSLYLTVNRMATVLEDWYCYYENKEEITEYQVKYNIVNQALENKQIINEKTIKEKYDISICKYSGYNKQNTIKYELVYNNRYDAYYPDGFSLKVNEKEVFSGMFYSFELEEFKDILLINYNSPPGFGGIFAVDKDGNKFDFKCDITGNEYCTISSKYEVVGNSIYFKVVKPLGNGAFDLHCYVEDQNSIASYTIKYDYLGNGKFKFDKILNEETYKDVYDYDTCVNIGINEDESIKYRLVDLGDNILYVNDKKVDLPYKDMKSIKVIKVDETLDIKFINNNGKTTIYSIDKDAVAKEVKNN